MSDRPGKARRFRERAAECLRLAEIAASEELKAEYLTIAGHYLTLALEEDNKAGRPSPKAH
jgi:hypothetical protein